MRKLVCAFTIMLALCWAQAAFAQANPTDYTTGYRFDAMQRLVGIIQPDPDGIGSGSLNYAAERYTYDEDGLLLKKESGELSEWKEQSIQPELWDTDFTVLQTIEYEYDGVGRKIAERVKGSNGGTVSLTQFSYDVAGRALCSVVRMNISTFANPEADACALGTQGSDGPDRITKNIYNAASQVLQVRKAVGVGPCPGANCFEQAYVTYGFTPNGQQQYVVDANGNKAELTYDGFDRQKRWIFPSDTPPDQRVVAYDDTDPVTAMDTAGAVNGTATGSTGDFEEYGYDANGNRTSLRKRDASVLTYQYDALNRMTVKTVPDTRPELNAIHTRDVYHSYDLTGAATAVRFNGSTTGDPGAISIYDGFGRLDTATNSMISTSPQLAYDYNANGSRTRITHPGSIAFDMTFDGLNRTKAIKQGSTLLSTPSYNNRGLLDGATRYSSAIDQSFGYDNVGRLSSLGFSQGTNSANVSWTYTHNPASQIRTEFRTNDSYAWTGRVDTSAAYTANGLNQYIGINATSFCYDDNGNLTADDASAFLYDVENRLVEVRDRESPSACPDGASGYGGILLATLIYDPMGRLHEVADSITGDVTRFLYDGNAMVLEYDGSNAIVNRYVHGNNAEADDPLVWYPGSGTANSNIRNLYADPRGSIVLVMDQNGSIAASDTGINSYDEWGANDGANTGRFQYTGQAWIPEVGLYYYKARFYSQRLGRFLQTDPIGYADQFNLYAYVANDPINGVDPTGLEIRVISDDAREKARVYAAIAITAETDPKVAERINTLERSDFVHRVQLGDIRNAGENVADYRPGGQVDMAGTGTGTVTTLQRGQFEKGGNQAISTIAHELAGHAYENDQGLLDRSRNPETGVRRSEESAVRIENVAREAIGLPVRETYLGRQVEDPRRELDD